MKIFLGLLVASMSLFLLSACATTDSNTPSFQPDPNANVSSDIADKVNRL